MKNLHRQHWMEPGLVVCARAVRSSVVSAAAVLRLSIVCVAVADAQVRWAGMGRACLEGSELLSGSSQGGSANRKLSRHHPTREEIVAWIATQMVSSWKY